jgi:hypothetical protein
MNALNLEQSLTQIAADNSFTTISVGRMPIDGDVTWTATVHWNSYSRDGITCAIGQSDDSIIDALRRAIAKAHADRTPANDVPAMLPALEAEIAA